MACSIPEIVKKSTFLKDVLRATLQKKKIGVLLANGYSYSQIAKALDLLLALGHLLHRNGEFQITQTGLDLLSEKKGTSSITWLAPLNGERIAKMATNEPYLPPRESMADISQRNSI